MKKTKTIKLLTISDLDDPRAKEAFKEITVISRIDSLLEDMNLDPFSMKGEIEIGDKARRTGVFSASDIGLDNGHSLCGKYVMGCGRYLFYAYTSQQSAKTWEPRLRRILDTGTAIHSQLDLYLHECARRESAKFQAEVDGNPDDNPHAISMHMDGLWEGAVPGIRYRFGMEFKSINDAGYKVTKGIHDNHITQVTVYQALKDLPVVLVVYYNKNDSHMSEHLQVFDKKRWSAIIKKLDMIRMHDLMGTMPPQEPSYKCNMCKYNKICKPPKKNSLIETRNLFRAKPRTVSGR